MHYYLPLRGAVVSKTANSALDDPQNKQSESAVKRRKQERNNQAFSAENNKHMQPNSLS